jgi:hypothetical protein
MPTHVMQQINRTRSPAFRGFSNPRWIALLRTMGIHVS